MLAKKRLLVQSFGFGCLCTCTSAHTRLSLSRAPRQAMKRLLSAVQRMYPTDPSRSADFQTTTDIGRGVAGSGSHKQALIEAEARGEVGGLALGRWVWRGTWP